jgi:hypothetical protein
LSQIKYQNMLQYLNYINSWIAVTLRESEQMGERFFDVMLSAQVSFQRFQDLSLVGRPSDNQGQFGVGESLVLASVCQHQTEEPQLSLFADKFSQFRHADVFFTCERK